MKLASSFDQAGHKSQDTSDLLSSTPCVIGPLCYHLLLLIKGDFIRLDKTNEQSDLRLIVIMKLYIFHKDWRGTSCIILTLKNLK